MTRRFFILLHCLVVMITASAQDAMVTKFANIPCDSDELLLKTIPYFTSVHLNPLTFGFAY